MLDPDKVLHDARLMKIDVTSGFFTKEQLQPRHPFLHKKMPNLFDMIFENDHGYWPELVNMINFFKSSSKEDILTNKASEDYKEKLANKYIYSIIPENPATGSSSNK